MHYLIVEDDVEIRNILRDILEILEPNGVYTFFKTGSEAWDWLDKIEEGKATQFPDIAMLDIRLPGPQGHEIAERIRKTDGIKDMGIILMTAYELIGDEYEEVMTRSKADRYITKPLPGVKGLNKMVEEIMALRRSNPDISDD